jgi:hypothetical protein
MTALLAQIFPVILLALGVESGRVSSRIRRRSWWSNWVLIPSVTCALIGFGAAVLSTQLGGAGAVMGVGILVLLGVASFGLVFVLIALMATDENTAEEEAASEVQTRDGELLRALEARSL